MLDFQDFKRSRRPNNYLVAPDGATNARIDASAPEFGVSPGELKTLLLQVLATQPRVEILGESDLAVEAVQRSAIMRFPDFISIQILPADAGSTLAVYSRAKYGYRDFGVNQKRVETWLAALKKAADGAS